MSRRVVITGLGVHAPNGLGLAAFESALREGRSGVRFDPRLAEIGLQCQVAGYFDDLTPLRERYLPAELAHVLRSRLLSLGLFAALDCWRDAGLEIPAHDDDHVDWRTGVIIGSSIGEQELLVDGAAPLIRAGKARRLGSSYPEQLMMSGLSACVGGLLGLGGRVTTNSSACSSGTEAIIEGAAAIRLGAADRMLVGAAEGDGIYAWAGLDAMRILVTGYNERPEQASRPMSASATGVVPSSGAGVLLLEELSVARARGAHIYAEVLGGHCNSGGQRQGGSMAAGNPEGARRCIGAALADARVSRAQVDLVNAHLTGSRADPGEVRTWIDVLGREGASFPWLTATKSLIGHAWGAAGAIECVATVLMLARGFVHPSINCDDLHPEIAPLRDRIARTVTPADLRVAAKASFGFGDVNACVIFGRPAERDRARTPEHAEETV